MNKKVTVRKDNGSTGETTEVHAVSVEQALRDVAHKVKKGELEPPFVLQFDGPSGLQFQISVDTPEAAGELQTQGFMF